MSFATNSSRRGLAVARQIVSKPVIAARVPSRGLSAISSLRPVVASAQPRWSKPIVAAARWKSLDSKSSWGPPIVKYDELKPITEQPSDDILLVDVREPDEIALGSIPSSVSIPLSVLKDHLNTTYSEGDFRKEHGFPKPFPQQKIIFYCRSGKRSATACELAGEAGYKNVRNYEGSWLDWTKKEQEAQAAGFKDDDED
jgi:rhodanese-related sulfurtransferase